MQTCILYLTQLFQYIQKGKMQLQNLYLKLEQFSWKELENRNNCQLPMMIKMWLGPNTENLVKWQEKWIDLRIMNIFLGPDDSSMEHGDKVTLAMACATTS